MKQKRSTTYIKRKWLEWQRAVRLIGGELREKWSMTPHGIEATVNESWLWEAVVGEWQFRILMWQDSNHLWMRGDIEWCQGTTPYCTCYDVKEWNEWIQMIEGHHSYHVSKAKALEVRSADSLEHVTLEWKALLEEESHLNGSDNDERVENWIASVNERWKETTLPEREPVVLPPCDVLALLDVMSERGVLPAWMQVVEALPPRLREPYLTHVKTAISMT